MNEITNQNIDEFVVSGTYDIQGSTSADAESKANKESVKLTFRFKLDKVSVGEILGDALTQKKINKQVSIRRNPELYEDGQVLEFDYKGGRGPVVDPITAIAAKAKAAGMTVEAYVVAEMKNRGLK